METKYSYLLKNLGIFTVSSFSTKILTFLIIPFYTFYLSTEEYATIDLINTSISLLLPLLTVCISDAVLRFVISNNDNKEEIYYISILFNILGSLILLIILPFFHYLNFFANHEIELYLVFVLTSFYNVFSNYSRAINKVKQVMIASIINTLILLSSNVILISFINFGISGYMISMVLALFITNIYYIIAVRPPTFSFKKLCLVRSNKGISKMMLRYSIPLIPNSVFWWINSAMDRYSLNFLMSLSTVGLYSVANKIPSMLSIFISIFQQAWNLSAFKEYNNGENDFFNKIFTIFSSIMILLSTFLILFTKVLAKFLFQKDFFNAWQFVPFLIIAFVFNSLNVFLGSFYTASKETKGLFTTTLYGAITNIILNFTCIPFLGATGAAIATCLSNIVVFIGRSIFTKKKFNFHVNERIILVCTIILSFQSIALINNYIILNFSFCLIVIFIIATKFINNDTIKYLKKQKENKEKK